MLQDDDEAVKLKHAEEVGFVIVPRVDQAAEVVQTSEEPLDLQAAAIAPRFAMVLGSPPEVGLVWSDQPDTILRITHKPGMTCISSGHYL